MKTVKLSKKELLELNGGVTGDENGNTCTDHGIPQIKLPNIGQPQY